MSRCFTCGSCGATAAEFWFEQCAALRKACPAAWGTPFAEEPFGLVGRSGEAPNDDGEEELLPDGLW